jgi:pimeloyl-ACP methyl ester carboxylesterase
MTFETMTRSDKLTLKGNEDMIKSMFHTVKPDKRINIFAKKSERPTAVLIHGLASSSRTWDEAVMFLMGKGFNVLTMDLSGHGDSSRAEKYSFSGWVNDVLKTLKKYEINNIDLMMGHSLGGLISVGVSLEVPTRRIIFIDPLIAPPNPIFKGFITRSIKANSDKTLEERIRRYPQRNIQTLMNDFANGYKWDPKTISDLTKSEGESLLSEFDSFQYKPEMLLVKPTKSIMISKKDLERLNHWGMSVVELDNTRHGVHLDNFEDFIAAVDAFI